MKPLKRRHARTWIDMGYTHIVKGGDGKWTLIHPDGCSLFAPRPCLRGGLALGSFAANACIPKDWDRVPRWTVVELEQYTS